jgi:hypothetical protein
MADIKQEILDWYNSQLESDEKVEYFDEVWPEFYEEIWGSGSVTLASGDTKTLEDFGGEGQGDQRWVVFAVGDKIYRVDGYYASWDGTTWEDPTPYEVKPVEVTVVKYKKV